MKIEVPNQDLLHALRAIMPMDLGIEKLVSGPSTVWVTASRLGDPEIVVTAVYRGSALPLNGRGCAHVAPEDAPRVARLLVEELVAKVAAALGGG